MLFGHCLMMVYVWPLLKFVEQVHASPNFAQFLHGEVSCGSAARNRRAMRSDNCRM